MTSDDIVGEGGFARTLVVGSRLFTINVDATSNSAFAFLTYSTTLRTALSKTQASAAFCFFSRRCS